MAWFTIWLANVFSSFSSVKKRTDWAANHDTKVILINGSADYGNYEDDTKKLQFYSPTEHKRAPKELVQMCSYVPDQNEI